MKFSEFSRHFEKSQIFGVLKWAVERFGRLRTPASCKFVLSTTARQWRCSCSQQPLPRMAPNLADSQHVQIRDMTLSNCPPAEIANVVGCSERSVFAIRNRRGVDCGAKKVKVRFWTWSSASGIAEAGIEASGWIELQTTAKKIARIEPKSSQNLPKQARAKSWPVCLISQSKIGCHISDKREHNLITWSN
jgi:hypothetical protein